MTSEAVVRNVRVVVAANSVVICFPMIMVKQQLQPFSVTIRPPAEAHVLTADSNSTNFAPSLRANHSKQVNETPRNGRGA